MRRQEDVRRRSVIEDRGKASPQQRFRESAEERGLAAAARLAAAVAAATSHCSSPQAAQLGDGKFRLRRHSAIGCCRTAPGQPTPPPRPAWVKQPEKVESRLEPACDRAPVRQGEQTREARPRVAPGEAAPTAPAAPARTFEATARPRLARAQSARRPTRPAAPPRARSADPRKRREEGFVPERPEARGCFVSAFSLLETHQEHPAPIEAGRPHYILTSSDGGVWKGCLWSAPQLSQACQPVEAAEKTGAPTHGGTRPSLGRCAFKLPLPGIRTGSGHSQPQAHSHFFTSSASVQLAARPNAAMAARRSTGHILTAAAAAVAGRRASTGSMPQA